jgi:hypothetical protein
VGEQPSASAAAGVVGRSVVVTGGSVSEVNHRILYVAIRILPSFTKPNLSSPPPPPSPPSIPPLLPEHSQLAPESSARHLSLHRSNPPLETT